MNVETEEEIIKRISEKDMRMLGVLYEKYKTILFNHFMRVTLDYDTSNDLLMETFVRIDKYSHTFKGGFKTRSWIYQISNNLIKDHFKKIKRSYTSIHFQAVDEEQTNIVLPIEIAQRDELLYCAISKLSPSERNIISMYYLLEMSYEDIANVENITINNARIKTCRGLKKLNKLLKHSEI
ncbi:sigma-70 family RNA polymerase sigma factor [Flavobacteriaceae bacterium AU392]|nr:RNA polymerase sigma factor [Flavobacteriaceae bacterium]RKM85997.1 sigma-70 family RNA polymerase sigma factor [Flavobacteriaceae bacterium AU392]